MTDKFTSLDFSFSFFDRKSFSYKFIAEYVS